MKFADIKLPSNGRFGTTFLIIFLLFGSYCFFYNYVLLSFVFFLISLTFFLVTLLKPNWLYPLNKTWMALGFILSLIMSPIVMGIIFFGVFTPTSIIMRLFGRDELRIRGKKRLSFWKERSVMPLRRNYFKQQY